MKIKVISEFYDKFHTSTLYKVGAVLDFEEARAKDIIERKLGVAFVEPKKEEQPAPKVEAPKVEAQKEEKPKEAEEKPKAARGRKSEEKK